MRNSQPLPLVSVLIPLYNHEQFIEQTLESIVSDSYPNKELIVIDDGSRDASFQRADQWRKENAHRFAGRFEVHTRENRGVSATLNELLALSRGEFIASVSSDDYILPGGIEARLEYLLNHPDKLMVFGDYVTIDYEGKKIHDSGIEQYFSGCKMRLSNECLFSYEMVFNWCLGGPLYMGRRELFERNGGYNESLSVEDWDFCLKLLPEKLIGFIDYPVGAYRIRPDELTREVTIPQRIRFNEAILQTVSNNLSHFTGIKKLYLFAEKLKHHGVLERLRGNNSLATFVSRKIGRLLTSLLKVVYHAYAHVVILMTPRPR